MTNSKYVKNVLFSNDFIQNWNMLVIKGISTKVQLIIMIQILLIEYLQLR